MIKEMWHTLEDGSQVSNYGNFLNSRGIPTGKNNAKGYKQVYYNKRYVPYHILAPSYPVRTVRKAMLYTNNQGKGKKIIPLHRG